jgi:hypothetical protein
MKITPTDRQAIRDLIAPLDTPERRAAYLAGDFPRADRVQNLDMRYRWDLLWALPAEPRNTVMQTVWLYADDTNLDTALRSIVPALVPAN